MVLNLTKEEHKHKSRCVEIKSLKTSDSGVTKQAQEENRRRSLSSNEITEWKLPKSEVCWLRAGSKLSEEWHEVTWRDEDTQDTKEQGLQGKGCQQCQGQEELRYKDFFKKWRKALLTVDLELRL